MPRRSVSDSSGVQAMMRARADDAAVDDNRFEVEAGVRLPILLRAVAKPILEVLQHFDLCWLQCFLKSVWKSNEIILPFNRWCAGDDPHRAARMHQGMIRPAHFHERDDLRSCEDVIRLV